MKTEFRVLVQCENIERDKATKSRGLTAWQPRLEADLEKRFSHLRKSFGFKRREISVAHEMGSASLITHLFEYHVSLQSQEDAGEVLWRREVILCPDGGWAMISDPKFQEVFGDVFHAVICEFPSALSIVDVIDRLEDREDSDLQLEYDSRCEWLEISKRATDGVIRLQGNRVCLQAGAGSSPLALARLFHELQPHVLVRSEV